MVKPSGTLAFLEALISAAFNLNRMLGSH